MLIYGAIGLSLLITFIFYYFFKTQYKWWEFFLPTISTFIVVMLFKLIVDTNGSNFSEIWGSTVISVYEEEPWNEWIHKTCSRKVACGTDSDGDTEYCTEYYDCSYQEDYPPKWYAITDIGQNINISERDYDKLVKQFGSNSKNIKQRRNYSPRDRGENCNGTKFSGKAVGQFSYVYQTDWRGTDDTRKAVSVEKTYINKIKASDLTLFNIKIVNVDEAKKMGLYDMPKLIDNLAYPTILGGGVSEKTQEKFKRLNGKFGPSNEMRLWVLVFENKPPLTSKYQENYWVKGNMNELVICIGKRGYKVDWCNVFTWSTRETLPLEIKDYIYNIDLLNEKGWNELYVYLDTNLNKFQRRDFGEFDYLKRREQSWEVIVAYIFAILIAVGVNFWAITNEYNDEE